MLLLFWAIFSLVLFVAVVRPALSAGGEIMRLGDHPATYRTHNKNAGLLLGCCGFTLTLTFGVVLMLVAGFGNTIDRIETLRHACQVAHATGQENER